MAMVGLLCRCTVTLFFFIVPLLCQETERLKGIVEKTKAEGKQTVNIQRPKPIYAFAYSLSDALRSERAIRVIVQQKLSQPDLKGNYIETWYLARIIDNLSKTDLPPVISLPLDLGVPTSLANSAIDGFVLVRELGGESLIDGVVVKSPEEVALNLNKEYILFGRFVDFPGYGSTRVYKLTMGKSGAFVVAPKSNVFTPIETGSSDRFIVDVLARTKASPDRLHEIAIML